MNAQNSEVVAIDVRMPFWSMVIFMVKWSIAAIPAILILVVLLAIIGGIFGGMFGGLLKGS